MVLLFRGIAINAAFIIFTNGLEQLCWIMVVETFYILLTVVFHPWRMPNANYLSLITSFSILYACSLNAIYVEDDIDHFWVAQMTVTITMVPVLTTMFIGAITVRTAFEDQTSYRARMRKALESTVDASRAFADIESTRLERLYNSVGAWDRWHLEKFKEVVETEFLCQRGGSRTMVTPPSPRSNANLGTALEAKALNKTEASTQCDVNKELYSASKPRMMDLEKELEVLQRCPPIIPVQESRLRHKVFSSSKTAVGGGVSRDRNVEMPK
jgi:hypothetical protein